MAEQDVTPLPDADPRVLARFLTKIDRNFGECWIWIASRDRKGYGKFGSNDSAHRMAWKLFRGPIPHGLCVLHRCDTPPCANPWHLFTGTRADNTADMLAKGREASGERSGARTHPERTPRGNSHGMAKLSEAQVLEIRDGSQSQSITAKRFGIAQSMVSLIRNRKKWAHLP